MLASFNLIYFEQDSQDFYKIEWFSSIILVSVLTYIANLLYFEALSLEKADRIAPANCLKPIFGLLFELVIFNHLPNWLSLVGAGVILLSTLSTILDNIKKN